MELLSYFYHPDHTSTGLSTGLGSSTWITDRSGQAIQHLHYLPFGEDWVDQRNSSWNAPYTFSGKEKDVETGYGYFGARYYDSGLSIWLSVDPMSDKYPNLSPYNYCANNLVILVDPDGNYFVKGEEILDFIKTRTTEMITNLLINSLILKSKKENSNSKRAQDRYQRKIDNINAMIASYQKVLDEIEGMEDDTENAYSIEYGGTYENNTKNAEGYTTVENNVCKMYIRNEYDLGTIAHELKHGFQFGNFEISFRPNGRGGSLYDLTDERQAFDRGFLYGKKYWSDSDIKRAYPDLSPYDLHLDNNSPQGQIDILRDRGDIFRKP